MLEWRFARILAMRKPVIAGNWKLFKTLEETVRFFDEFKPLVAGASRCEIVICPPFPSLAAAAETTRGANIAIGAQNLYWERDGAYTGEVSAPMIAAVGASHVIIGHSERRQYFGETDERVNKKIFAALGASLTPILCVGETLEQRESEATEAVLSEQFAGGTTGLTRAQFSRIIVAYEPVWAIGTGRTATPDTAAEAHRFLREQAAARFGAECAEALRVLYGGSVKPANVKALMERDDIDGGLVGGASLEPESFAAIVHFER